MSRQTLIKWREEGRQALLQVVTPRPRVAAAQAADVVRPILTLLMAGHASYRGIQQCLAELLGRTVSLGTISAVVAEAGRRAQAVLATLVPPQPCALALDELFAGDPTAAFLSAVDATTGVVWATAGPVAADAASWTVLMWELQAHGGHWHTALTDGGNAAAAGATMAAPTARLGRDVWHVLAKWAQVQRHLDRRVSEARAKLAIRERYAATIATDQRWRGRVPTTSLAEQTAVMMQESALAEAVRYLGQEWRQGLAVVVVQQERVIDAATRQEELATVLTLLTDLSQTAPAAMQPDLARLHAHLSQALPGLLTMAEGLDPLHHDLGCRLGEANLALVAWGWQRREALGLADPAALLAALPPTWRAAARVALTAWAGTARTTSLAETWHSLLRTQVVIHRGLSPALLALTAVWHNHRVVSRGVHAGTSPLQRSGVVDVPTDWLSALGYPASATHPGNPPTPLLGHLEEVAA
jgi:hypothetical protein